MADDDFDDVETSDQNSGGGALRKRLEEALAENKKLRADQAKFAAQDLISTKGFKYVKPEDLAPVPLDQHEAAAQRIEQERIQERRQMLADTLAESRGLSGEALELAVTELLNPQQRQSQEALANLAALGRAGGTPIPQSAVPEGVYGPQRLKLAFGA